MTTVAEQYVFLRHNLGSFPDSPPTRLSEKEARVYLSTSIRNVDRAIDRLKRGQEVRTRFATYSAKVIPTREFASSIS